MKFYYSGTIVPATEKTVWKKCEQDSNEPDSYEKLMNDDAADIVPKFYKKVEHKGDRKFQNFVLNSGFGSWYGVAVPKALHVHKFGLF